MKFVTRAYNKIELNALKGTIVKTSEEKRLGDEIYFYREIPEPLKHYFPRVCSAKTSKPYRMELEYFPFENLGVISEKETSQVRWEMISKKLSYMLDSFSSFQEDFGEFASTYRYDMFINKTESEYQNLIKNFDYFSDIQKYHELIINENTYKNFSYIWPKLKNHIKKEYCNSANFSFMHGDFCASNILCGFDSENNPIIKLIDPRGSFGEMGVWGDGYYDIAKLLHSIEGQYESIIYDRFKLETKNNKVDFVFEKNNFEVLKQYLEIDLLNKFDLLKAKIIEGTIFIGMCARHHDSLNRQKIMYATGIQILNDCLEKLK